MHCKEQTVLKQRHIPSQCQGDDSANAEDKDLASNPRKVGTIDMGAYERQ